MPLVFAHNEENLSDKDYADIVGEVYEFPLNYKGLVQPGEQFVYYRGRRRPDGPSEPQVYFGTGLVGPVYPSGERFQCLITNYQPFNPEVPFKKDGSYREPGATKYHLAGKPPGKFFTNGVRPIDQMSFDAICEDGLGAPGPTAPSPATGGQGYGDRAGIVDVDEIAMELALREAIARWPTHNVRAMPHNNPGFDIEISGPDGPMHYIEVKGTRAHYPRFFISAGEVGHSVRYAHCYSLWIFHSLDTTTRTATLAEHDGAVTESHFDLRTKQYFGRLLTDD